MKWIVSGSSFLFTGVTNAVITVIALFFLNGNIPSLVKHQIMQLLPAFIILLGMTVIGIGLIAIGLFKHEPRNEYRR